MPDDHDLAALVASRICHDLISPIGAIGNGLELVAMTGAPNGPEMELIVQSVAQANARLRLFRLAFGAAGDGAVPVREVREILDGMTAGTRLVIDWQPPSATRREVKIAFLLLQCLETAMPYGGRITVHGPDRIEAEAPRLRALPDLWPVLQGAVGEVGPAQAHFLLAARAISTLGRQVEVTETPTALALRY
ncbi:histidine phosphotransferase family protein [Falsirhodobacter halotolerans]|uniref:histidine phosphotransferase family protein n=1 Tax=Falsirhodobacter halotolerans TaxID=1146892 RepID=UPI001FD1001C|nr:histidine phosphotransferase family protein [Falsirhodobacter halotolerans]MCJ8139195.1 histidine phosphotransferase family protein [Falsirhodobacter halotolerans]